MDTHEFLGVVQAALNDYSELLTATMYNDKLLVTLSSGQRYVLEVSQDNVLVRLTAEKEYA